MSSEPTTSLLTLEEAAERLGVKLRTVQEWVYGGEDSEPVLDSFTKVKGRRISEEALARFVLANTLRARRPKWLTEKVESEFMQKMRQMIQLEVQRSLQSANTERVAA